MSNKRLIGFKAREEMQKSIKLAEIAVDLNLSFEKGKELKKKQDEAFKKAQFFKNLNRAMNEVENG